MAAKEQIKKIYSLGAAAGLLNSSMGADDELHLWVRSVTLKEHISELTDKQADFVIAKLKEYCMAAKETEIPDNGISDRQKSYIFSLMYKLAKLSPSEVPTRDRLAGIVKSVIGRELSKDILKGVSIDEGSAIIETLKRYISTEERKAKRKESGIRGTGTTDKERPP